LRCFTFKLLTAIALPLLCYGSAVSEDTVAYVGGKENKQTIRRSGTIEDYSGEGLVLITTQGRKETIPLEKLIEFHTTGTEEEQLGDKLKNQGKPKEAIAAYQKAKRTESRRWVLRRISHSLVDCLDATGQIDQAGSEFLLILGSDSETPYFGSIPLAWRNPSLDAPPVTQAGKWLANTSQPAAALLGASWLLSGPERAKAITVLKTLTSDLDPRIAHLAAAELWRTSLVTASPADAQKWQQQIERMPNELRAGPLLVLGDLHARLDQADEALLAYLQIPLVNGQRQILAAEGLTSAAKLLEKLKRPDDASRLYREREAKYPALAK
jgi:tetratricopeptide (TPR) repeat protein